MRSDHAAVRVGVDGVAVVALALARVAQQRPAAKSTRARAATGARLRPRPELEHVEALVRVGVVAAALRRIGGREAGALRRRLEARGRARHRARGA